MARVRIVILNPRASGEPYYMQYSHSYRSKRNIFFKKNRNRRQTSAGARGIHVTVRVLLGVIVPEAEDWGILLFPRIVEQLPK
jgi:hypothetical protein